MQATNIAHLQKGSIVRIKQDQLKGKEPSTWQNNAKLIGFEKDLLLTEMNKRHKAMYRCIIRFDGKPTTKDIQTYGQDRCIEASVLPLMLETI